MKSFKHLIGAAALAMVAGSALTSCQNDFDQPPLKEPEATLTPNTTIAQLKADNWQTADSYYQTIGTNAEGEDLIIRGRVVSSDATGNIYKSLVIQDETAALAFSIDQSGMNNAYRLGQEVVINVTGLGIGKYRGLQQIGGYGEYNGTPQTSFMDYNLFQEHTELNHFPNPAYTLVEPGQENPTDGKMYAKVVDLGSLPTTPTEIQKMQSQLVLLRNVHFELGGQAPFSEDDASTNRNLLDENGNSIIVRNSSYASFHAKTLPAGTGDVMGILSYFGSDWQLLLRSADDCMFESKGQKDDPYTVAEAIEGQGSKSGWVSGYIVGSVKAGVSAIESNDNIIWGANAEMDNTLVIASDANVTDYTKCLVVALPQGSALRAQGNLIDNPGNIGKAIAIRGTFDSFMGTYGIVDNSGAADSFSIEGQDTPVTPGEGAAEIDETFDASTSIPQGWLNVQLKGTKTWFIKEFSGNNYASMTGYKGTAPFDSWLISPAVDCSKMTEKVASFRTQVNGYGSTTTNFEVYILTGSSDPETATLNKVEVALPTAPDSGYSSWVESGKIDLSKYSGIIYLAFRYTATQDAEYATWCVDDVLVGKSTSSGTVVPPVDPTGQGSEESPYTVADVKASTSDVTGVWIEGYIVGWVSGMNWASGATFDNNPAADFANTNFILGPTEDANTTTTTIPCAIPAGSLRDLLGLGKNPSMYKKHVIVKGDITKYFGQRGVKNITEYKEL